MASSIRLVYMTSQALTRLGFSLSDRRVRARVFKPENSLPLFFSFPRYHPGRHHPV